MSELTHLYPPTPVNVPATTIQASASFKKEVKGVMGSIVLFFIVYLLMFLLSAALIVGCVYAGIAIIVHIRHLLAIFAGIGLVGLGVMVFIFLVKFLFSVNRFDRSGSIEITENDQPGLFGFIRQLAIDTKTPVPKKIYLSPDVNACVFYDSSFWSMFLPIRKNLQIGLGLVNAVNISEFKAVMAHEFGHFSQRSMKLGSFVYNVNKIIHNMLFDNTGYSGFLSRWASISDVFAFFAGLTARVAQGIQWVLRQMYAVVNKNYMSLSREMEFHADAVAASVSGSKSLVTALRRLELADAGYNVALQKCEDLFKEKKISHNIYQNQTLVLKHLANEYKLVEDKGLPVVTDDFRTAHNSNRVNYKDQWASHPSTTDRETRLMQLAIEAEIISEPAWALFSNKEQLERQLTHKLYEKARDAQNDLVEIDNAEFESIWKKDIKRFSLPLEYKGFYDNRLIEVPGEENEKKYLTAEENGKTNFEEIFCIDNTSLPKKIRLVTEDLELLRDIAEKRVHTKTFDFDGKKYNFADAQVVAQTVESELKQDEETLKAVDLKATRFFLAKAYEKGAGEELTLKYKDYFEYRRKSDLYLVQMNRMLESLALVFAGQSIPIEQINAMISVLKETHEPEWKKLTGEWLLLGVFDDNISTKHKLRQFIDNNYQYFEGTSFFETELAELNELCNTCWNAVQSWIFNRFKSMLEMQLTLMEEKAVA